MVTVVPDCSHNLVITAWLRTLFPEHLLVAPALEFSATTKRRPLLQHEGCEYTQPTRMVLRSSTALDCVRSLNSLDDLIVRGKRQHAHHADLVSAPAKQSSRRLP